MKQTKEERRQKNRDCAKKYRAANLEKCKADCRAWRLKNLGKAKVSARAWAVANPERRRELKRKSTWRSKGIDAQAAALLWETAATCSICGTTDKSLFCVDHCHKTTKIRGILCDNCNRGLGLLGDTYAALLKAAAYLLRAESQSA